MYGNAVDICGVWSATALSEESLDTQRSMGCPIFGANLFTNPDRAVVQEWTEGARTACTAFRAQLTELLAQAHVDVPTTQLTPKLRGQLAFYASVKALL